MSNRDKITEAHEADHDSPMEREDRAWRYIGRLAKELTAHRRELAALRQGAS